MNAAERKLLQEHAAEGCHHVNQGEATDCPTEWPDRRSYWCLACFCAWLLRAK